MSHNKIHFLPHSIKGKDQVAKIFERYQNKAKKHG